MRNRDPDMLQELYSYCEQDVIAESEIRKRLRDLRGTERQIWELDQRINWRGVRLDKENIDHALAIIADVERELNAEVFELTDGEMSSTGSRAKALEWINRQGVTMETYDKACLLYTSDAADEP